MNALQISEKLGVNCTDNTSAYFEEGVELVGLAKSMKFFDIEDPKSNPEGYGFEIIVNEEKGTFHFAYDGQKLKIEETRIDELNPTVYEKAVEKVVEYLG